MPPRLPWGRAAPSLSDEELLARVLYRDALMLVIDKPAGLPVHPGPGGGPTLEHGLGALRFGLHWPPALAHRLDRDTSGCLVLGRHRQALARLGRLFAAGRVDKRYLAVVDGEPPESAGRIELSLAKRSAERGWWMKVDPRGQRAVTEYEVRARAAGRTVLELRPLTGRTHQLRVHLAAIGCPILGDRVYGGERERDGGPLQLHAHAVAVPLYPRRPPIEVRAPLPPHMADVAELGLEQLGGSR
jgi:tRNA pseudouridine32 synthase / 23S rRNA pseudouridine746 synthase